MKYIATYKIDPMALWDIKRMYLDAGRIQKASQEIIDGTFCPDELKLDATRDGERTTIHVTFDIGTSVFSKKVWGKPAFYCDAGYGYGTWTKDDHKLLSKGIDHMVIGLEKSRIGPCKRKGKVLLIA